MNFISPMTRVRTEKDFLSSCDYSTLCLFKTTDYSFFKKYDKNRNINKSNIERLCFSIKRKNFLMFNPIIVSVDGHVIDGQHRLEACKKLQEPVYFIVYNSEDYREIIQSLNSAQEKWKVDDYIEFHEEEKDVQFIKKIHELTGVSSHILLKTFFSNASGEKRINSVGESFSIGIEVSEDKDDILDFCEFYLSIKRSVSNAGRFKVFLKSSGFFKCLWYLYKHPVIDNERLKNVMISRIDYIVGPTTLNRIRVSVLTQYNRSRHAKNMLAFNQTSGLIAGKVLE